jgi:hypothetical protein
MDLPGIALIITAFGAVVGPAVTAYLQLRAAKLAEKNKQEAIDARVINQDELKAGQAEIHTLVDGHSSEQTRQITALHAEIARLQTPGTITPQQTAGDNTNPVGIDKGVVTVAPDDSKPE